MALPKPTYVLHKAMRTIKFRGKNNSGEWIYGSLLTWPNGHTKIYDTLLADGSMGGHDVDPETVGQFTGLLDLNGNEVYEGDIVMYDGNPELGQRIVAFYDQAFCIFDPKEYEYVKRGSSPYMNDYQLPTCMNEWSVDGLLKVVGNIYDKL